MTLVFVCLRDDLILAFWLQQLRRETGRFELASTITLVLQAKRLTKCASYPIGLAIQCLIGCLMN